MDSTIFTQASQLGGTVFTTVAFLWYLLKTSDKQIASQVSLAKSLQRLTDVIEKNTFESGKNLMNRKENTSAIDKNTEVVDKNTEVVSKINGHK